METCENSYTSYEQNCLCPNMEDNGLTVPVGWNYQEKSKQFIEVMLENSVEISKMKNET